MPERKRRKLQEIAELGEAASGYDADAGMRLVLNSRRARYNPAHRDTEEPRIAGEARGGLSP